MAEAGLSRTVFYRHFEALPQVVLALLAKLPPGAESYELARALNLMNSQYLMDTLGRDPGFDRELAQRTLLAIWSATAQYWRRAHT